MRMRTPRAAHCLGCGVTFEKMHLMINHRRNERCGGRFLSVEERNLYDKAKVWFEAMLKAEREGDDKEYSRCFRNRAECLHTAYRLRKERLSEQAA